MSKQHSIKTRFLNVFRSMLKIRILEEVLIVLIKKSIAPGFVKKLVPNNYQYKPNTFRTAVSNGIKYKFDISDYLQHTAYFQLGTEPYDTLFNLIKPGFYILDIGTNFGHTILEMAARTGKDGRLYGFEPVPYLYSKALENILLNSFSNIKLVNKAISSSEGEVFFDDQANTHNSGGIQMTFSQKKHKIDAITLDSFIQTEKPGRVDLIKADIEGFEMEMLKGAHFTINKYKPVLFLELNNSYLGRNGSSTAEVIKLLTDWGYRVYNAETQRALLCNDDYQNTHIDVVAHYSK